MNWRALAWDLAKAAVGLAAAAFIALRVAQDWETIGPLFSRLNLPLAAMALIAQGLAFLLFPIPSYFILRQRQPTLTYLTSARMFFLSQLTKYLPGSIWVFPSRVVLMRQAGFSVRLGMYTLAFETLAFLTSGLMVGLVAIGSFPDPFRDWSALVALLTILGIAATILLLAAPGRLLALLPVRWRGAVPSPGQQTSGRQSSSMTFVALVSLTAAWLLSGASLWLLSIALNPQGAISLLTLAGTFSLAWVAGFVVILSPGGVGVREAILIAVLSALIPQNEAVFLALASRLLWWLCELMLYFFSAYSARGIPTQTR
ncbi:MAG: lysylphosphatidylglycerol synthase domain-containing protein [Anaerolineales bacterium]